MRGRARCGGGGLDGEGDDGAANLDGGGVVEVEVEGVVGQDERAELGQVVFQLELLQLPVVLYHRVAPRHRDVAHSHVRVVASSDHELNFCLFRHQQVHHPRAVLLEGQRLQQQEVPFFRDWHVHQLELLPVRLERVRVRLLADLAFELLPHV